jgi:hypothetical protein
LRKEKLKKPDEKEKIDNNKYKLILKRLNNLAKPKDRWRTGRVMLNLKKKFTYDNILRKMIKLEFRKNKRFKFPEEYAVYDSDEERKILFKNGLEKNIKKENFDRVREMLQKTKFMDDDEKRSEDSYFNKIKKQDQELEKYIKRECINYFKQMESRLESTEVISINNFLSKVYKDMLKMHKEATERRFPVINYGFKHKKQRQKVKFSREFRFYFMGLIRRLKYNDKGKLIFGRLEDMPFWAPTLSNKCKVHRSNCPLYCNYNSHNDVILTQKVTNFKKIHNMGTEVNIIINI